MMSTKILRQVKVAKLVQRNLVLPEREKHLAEIVKNNQAAVTMTVTPHLKKIPVEEKITQTITAEVAATMKELLKEGDKSVLLTVGIHTEGEESKSVVDAKQPWYSQQGSTKLEPVVPVKEESDSSSSSSSSSDSSAEE